MLKHITQIAILLLLLSTGGTFAADTTATAPGTAPSTATSAPPSATAAPPPSASVAPVAPDSSSSGPAIKLPPFSSTKPKTESTETTPPLPAPPITPQSLGQKLDTAGAKAVAFGEYIRSFFSNLDWTLLLLSLLIATGIFVILRVVTRFFIRIMKLKRVGLSLTLLLLAICIRIFLILMQVEQNTFVINLMNVVIFVLGCYILIRLFEEVFVRIHARRKKHLEFPSIILDVCRLILTIIVLLFSFKLFLNFEPTAIIATSTVISAVVGFAMQDVLGNVIAGVALQIGKPFKVGDWVQIAGQEGMVTQVQWRSTVLRTTKNHCVTVPNSSVAKAEILNFSAPNKLEVRSLDIGVDYQTQPNTVKKVVLQAILSTDGVKQEPAPECRLISFNEYTVTYRLWFWIDDFQNYGPIEERVMTNLWYFFKREGIVIPYPIQTLRMDTISRQQMLEDRNTQEIRAKALEALAGVDILKSLSPDELDYLAERVRTVMFGRGEIIVHQGDEGSEFYIIVNGRVQIIVEKDERVIFTADKEAGYFFGEMSLLTGQPRMATIRALADTEVIAIDKNAFDGVLRANPSIIDKLSETIEKRMQQVSASEDAINADKGSENTLLMRIKRFFGIG